jgi:hypothetical protein
MRCIFVSLFMFALLSCSDQDPNENPVFPVENSIEIVSIAPPPNSTLTKESVISANLRYTLAPDEKSEYGYKIWIQFTKPGDSTSYSIQPNSVDLNSRAGTVSLDHAILEEWQSADTRHPIQIHYSLIRKTSLSSNKLLVKTPKVDYTE